MSHSAMAGGKPPRSETRTILRQMAQKQESRANFMSMQPKHKNEHEYVDIIYLVVHICVSL